LRIWHTLCHRWTSPAAISSASRPGPGAPPSPHNKGTLCPKGAAICPAARQSESADESLTPCPRRHRLGGLGSRARVAELTKKTRDETFIERLSDGRLVNMTPAIFSLGHAPDGGDQTDDEERLRHERVLPNET